MNIKLTPFLTTFIYLLHCLFQVGHGGESQIVLPLNIFFSANFPLFLLAMDFSKEK